MVTYLSQPLVRGYTTGSACHVCVSQLKYLFGVSPARYSGPLSLIYVSIYHTVYVMYTVLYLYYMYMYGTHTVNVLHTHKYIS